MILEIGEGERSRRSKCLLTDEGSTAAVAVRQRRQGGGGLLLVLLPLVVGFLHGVGRGQERRQRRAEERGVGRPPHLAHHQQAAPLVEGVLLLGDVPGAGGGDVGEAGERLGLPGEEIGQPSPGPKLGQSVLSIHPVGERNTDKQTKQTKKEKKNLRLLDGKRFFQRVQGSESPIFRLALGLFPRLIALGGNAGGRGCGADGGALRRRFLLFLPTAMKAVPLHQYHLRLLLISGEEDRQASQLILQADGGQHEGRHTRLLPIPLLPLRESGAGAMRRQRKGGQRRWPAIQPGQ